MMKMLPELTKEDCIDAVELLVASGKVQSDDADLVADMLFETLTTLLKAKKSKEQADAKEKRKIKQGLMRIVHWCNCGLLAQKYRYPFVHNCRRFANTLRFYPLEKCVEYADRFQKEYESMRANTLAEKQEEAKQ